MIRIRPERLLADLQAFRGFGASGTGVVRRALSPIDVASHRWLADRYEEAGLTVAGDRFGNLFGLAPDRNRALLIGSHGDTQPRGGWLDGAMGVIVALEIARAARECGVEGALGIDAVCWSDEEARFEHFLGSSAYCGTLSDETIAASTDADGVRLTDAIVAAGYADLPAMAVDRARHAAYLEPHIEQGPVLDGAGLQLGIVDAIVGAREFIVTFLGEANHSGTAPMAFRKDAVRAMVNFAAALDARYEALADGAIVWTFGWIEVSPNAASIVPESAAMTVQFRAPTVAMLDLFQAELHAMLDRGERRDPGVRHTIRQLFDYCPTPMDLGLTAVLQRAAEAVAPGKWRTMPSGAGHDAQLLAPLMPTGMLFVPSIGGVSHSFEEDTKLSDIVAGCEAIAIAASEILEDAR